MTLRLLLDTHIVVRWLSDPAKLSRNQRRVLAEAIRRGESVGVSASSLLEIVLLAEGRRPRIAGVDDLFRRMDTDPVFRILPLTTGVASEFAAIGDSLRDPSDRAIVATARIHSLHLVTSDQRIIASKLTPVVE